MFKEKCNLASFQLYPKTKINTMLSKSAAMLIDTDNTMVVQIFFKRLLSHCKAILMLIDESGSANIDICNIKETLNQFYSKILNVIKIETVEKNFVKSMTMSNVSPIQASSVTCNICLHLNPM